MSALNFADAEIYYADNEAMIAYMFTIRRFFNSARVENIILHHAVNKKGLTKEQLGALKETQAKRDESICAICQEYSFKGDNSKQIELPCRHSFHKDCILKWLKNNETCPLCRQPVK